MLQPSVPLWEQSVLRKAAGNTLRPGGFQLTDRAAQVTGLIPGWRVLDVGSGLGATVNRLCSRYGAKAYGVELSSDQICRAPKGTNLIQAHGETLPFGDEMFDMVLCECVLSLFSDPKLGLEEARRVLRPSGFLILSDLYALDFSPVKSGSCAQGAMPLSATRAMVEAHGFTVLLVEDYSYLLKELAARLLFAQEADQSACACSDRRDLGYYLMIAQKRNSVC